MKRMTFIKELRWWLASQLLLMVVKLTSKEATLGMSEALLLLTERFAPDPKYDVVPMRRRKEG